MLATPESVASQSLWPCWFPPGLSFLRHILLAKASFLFTWMWRLFATVSILPHGIPGAFESGYLQITFRIARRLAQVCKLPLKIWLFSASGRDLVRQVSRAIGTLSCKRSFLFALVWRLFATVAFYLAVPERFRELPILFLHLDGSVA